MRQESETLEFFQRAALMAVLAVAVGIRLWGLDAGLPLVLNGDEVAIVERSLNLSLTNLNPGIFMYGSLPFYVARLATWVADLCALVFQQPALNVANYYLIVRTVSVIAGTVSVYFVYIFGKRLGGWNTGIISAMFLAVSPLAVELSHYATVDALLGVWVTLSFVGMVGWVRGSLRDLYLAALAIGLAVSTKYNAAVLILPLVLIGLQLGLAKESTFAAFTYKQKLCFGVLLLGGWIAFGVVYAGRAEILAQVGSWASGGVLQPAYTRIFDRLLLFAFFFAVVASALCVAIFLNWMIIVRPVRALLCPTLLRAYALIILVFFLTSPYVFLEYQHSLRDFFFQFNKNLSGGIASLGYQSRMFEAALDQTGMYHPFQYVFALLAEWGWMLVGTAVIGLTVFHKNERILGIAFIVLVCLTLIMTLSWSYLALRYIFPIWPVIAVSAAAGIVFVSQQLRTKIFPPLLTQSLTPVLLGVVLVPLTLSAVSRVHANFLVPDTRTLMAHWIVQNIPSGARIVREMDTPDVERVGSGLHVWVADPLLLEFSPRDWQAKGYNLMLLGNRNLDFYLSHKDKFQDVLERYAVVENNWRLLQSFKPDAATKGPALFLYSAP